MDKQTDRLLVGIILGLLLCIGVVSWWISHVDTDHRGEAHHRDGRSCSLTLRHNPDSALTSGLSTPLMLTLIRDTYRPGDDVSALLTTGHGSVDDDIEKRLVGRVLPDA
jgi:hypothetical protein